MQRAKINQTNKDWEKTTLNVPKGKSRYRVSALGTGELVPEFLRWAILAPAVQFAGPALFYKTKKNLGSNEESVASDESIIRFSAAQYHPGIIKISSVW